MSSNNNQGNVNNLNVVHLTKSDAKSTNDNSNSIKIVILPVPGWIDFLEYGLNKSYIYELRRFIIFILWKIGKHVEQVTNSTVFLARFISATCVMQDLSNGLTRSVVDP